MLYDGVTVGWIAEVDMGKHILYRMMGDQIASVWTRFDVRTMVVDPLHCRRIRDAGSC